ncbi:MAG: hypothetical protein J6Y57_09770 [Lachnospiraceae bacterium]|nr:hypothetical protein [Lachnospiraceae bacterium]
MRNHKTHRLSDMFVKEEKHPQLELIVKIVNINYGQRNKVLNSCRTLKEYAKFIAMIRENQKTMILKKAVTKAVDDCIARGILKEFLIRQKPRVIEMSILYEYDAEKQREFDREEGKEELLFSLIANALKRGKKYNEIAEFLQVTPDQIKKVEETL